jgi:TonB family protein
MLEEKTLLPNVEHALEPGPPLPAHADKKQRRLMIIALLMLMVALGFVLYHDRDFWFPDTDEADMDQPAEDTATATAPGHAPAHPGKSKHRSAPNAKLATNDSKPTPASVTAHAVVSRTELPPLEIEVVAGNTHRRLRPGNNAVQLDLRPESPPQPASSAFSDTAATVTSNATERVQMSGDSAEVVSRPVQPNYPLLARQMKVQGSVVLQALIGKSGEIQDLQVLSGPPILATAAQDAVKQWHFKPHFQGAEPVEAQAKITVNFTISTN